MFFSYENLQFRYEPYPIGIARPAIAPRIYEDLIANYPPLELFAYHPKVGHKYTLSERSNPDKYREILRTRPIWGELHRWIKSDAFIVNVMDALRAHRIDLGYHGEPPLAKRLQRAARRLARGRLDLLDRKS